MRRKIWSAFDIGHGGEKAPAGGEGGGVPVIRGGEGGDNPNVGGGEGGSPTVRAGGEGSGVAESDIRMKDGVEQIGRTVRELPLYRFRYKGGVEEYSGVMAQDVLEVMPEAVSVGPDGFYRVNYRMLGISMTRLDGRSVAAGGEGGGSVSDLRLKDLVGQIGTVAVMGGGEGSSEEAPSDIRLKDRVERIGTVRVVL